MGVVLPDNGVASWHISLNILASFVFPHWFPQLQPEGHPAGTGIVVTTGLGVEVVAGLGVGGVQNAPHFLPAGQEPLGPLYPQEYVAGTHVVPDGPVHLGGAGVVVVG